MFNSKGILISTCVFDDAEKGLVDIKNTEFEEHIPESYDGDDNPYEDAEIFLHGSCDLFALALHQIKGYAGIVLCNSEGDDVHYFCKKHNKGILYFIDVRGITCDIEEIVSEFVVGEYSLKEYEFPEDNSLTDEEQYGLKFAKRIIEEENWYNIS